MIPWSFPDICVEEREAVQHVMDSGWLSQGPETKSFERELADYIGCKYVVCVNSGTSALLCATVAPLFGKVVVPAYSFPATWNVARILDYKIKYVDVDPKTFIMRRTFVKGTQIPVSLAGLPLDDEDGWVEKETVEDGCEALGSETRKGKTGSKWTTCFSFHMAKLVTTIEGGAIATNDEGLARAYRLIRNHGEDPDKKYSFLQAGLNLRTTDVNSAIGRVQLRKLPRYLKNRASIAAFYREELDGLVGFQEVPDYVKVHSNMFFPILVRDPDHMAAMMLHDGIDTRRPFPPAVPMPNATEIYRRILAIPIYNAMTVDEATPVVESVKRCL